MYLFLMPSLGADMEAGTLIEWTKHPGDTVKRGDVVAVVETDKGAIEVEIFVDGVMGKQLVGLNAKVPVGVPLAEIEGVEAEAAPLAAHKPAAPLEASARPAPPQPETRPLTFAGGEQRATPAARKRAAEKNISLTRIKGTGPGGAIVLKDVEQAEEPGARRGLDLARMREAIAAAMARSKREIPHYYLSTDIDMSAALSWLSQTNETRTPDERLLPAVLTLKAVALAARKYPALNGFFDPAKGFTPSEDVHIGVAVAIRGGGLVSPAIHDCDKLGPDQLMEKLRDLAGRAREGRLRSSELSDGTITVSNLGERGVESLYGVIYPPQVAIICLGTITHRPAAVDNQIEVRPVMTATLAADHRVSDGHLGARFLKHVNALLQKPEKL